MPKDAKRSPRNPTIPDASTLADIYRMAKRLTTTATANAWGMLGGIAGDATWSFWRHIQSPFLSRVEVLTIGYCVAVAIYTLIIRTETGVAKSLAFAALIFSEGQITNVEYQQIRKTCLMRAGLIGKV